MLLYRNLIYFFPCHLGTRPPDCSRPCTRVRSCGHPQLHNCHPEASGCPPCTTLCEKWCYGKHEKRKNIPCHLTDVSCGKNCARRLRCGRHSCLVSCHTGPCPTTCSQPCTVARPDCGHFCALPCHDNECPVTPCREKVKVQCQVIIKLVISCFFLFVKRLECIFSAVNVRVLYRARRM